MVVQVGRLVFLYLFLFKLFFRNTDSHTASLNSGLSREHVCCHMFLPARVFPSSLGNTPVTEIGGSPGTSSFSGLIGQKWVLNQSLRNCMGGPERLGFFCPASAGQQAPVGAL